jgi:hypothetical protein
MMLIKMLMMLIKMLLLLVLLLLKLSLPLPLNGSKPLLCKFGIGCQLL